MMNTIGVLTSGGDAPGMNAAIRAVVRTACELGIKVYGINDGYEGLMNGDMNELNIRSVCNIINKGGTILYSARSLRFKTEEGMLEAIRVCNEKGIDGLVVIGGDGSFRGARDLSLKGVPCVAIPGTIDNDIGCTELTIGYDTALNTIARAVDKLRDTTESHHRCSVIEVMGNNAGFLTLNAGIACGAAAIIIPEIEYDFDRDVIERMKRTMMSEKKHFIVMIAENICNVQELAKKIQTETGVDTRATILGHVQRGGSPTVSDRILASKMGYHAVALLKEGIGNRVVATKHDEIIDIDIYKALAMKKSVDLDLYKMAMEISI